MVGIAAAKCILVLGATSGIGRALATALHALPSNPTVLVGGRRKERLDELCKSGERFRAIQVDINRTPDELRTFVDETLGAYPDLDAVLISSGVQHIFKFNEPEKIDFKLVQDEFNTNYVAPVTIMMSLLPHFLKLSEQGRPTFIMPVTSGLGICPGAWVPNYSATKAAVHSFVLSLAMQLKDTHVHIMEIIPPLVESELHDHQGTTPKLVDVWQPLAEFTPQVMAGLERGDLYVAAGGAVEMLTTFHEHKKVERTFAGKPLLSHRV